MKVLLTGVHGQLGSEMLGQRPDGVEITGMDMQHLDITDADAVREQVLSLRPDWIVNCAAYTAVDRAEEEAGLAHRVNADGPGNLARAAADTHARMIQVSTDFVFNGRQGWPYQPGDVPEPLGVYGASKLAGEREVLAAVAERCIIIRTAWVYGVHGSNFVRTMLRLMTQRDALSVVCDQVGTPSWTANLARAIWRCMTTDASSGVYHWTDLGACSWYDFAVAIQEEGLRAGLLQREIPVTPIPAAEYPTLATRPHYSVLDTSALRKALGLPGQHWRAALREMLAALAKEQVS